MEYTVELKRGGGCSNVFFSFIYLFQAFIFIFIYLFLSVISESLNWDRHGEESQMSTMMGKPLWLFPVALILFPKLEPILAAIGPHPGQVAGLLQG